MSRLARFIVWSGMLHSTPKQVAVVAAFIWVLTFALVVAILTALWAILGEHFGGGARDIVLGGCLWATGYTVVFLLKYVYNDVLGGE